MRVDKVCEQCNAGFSVTGKYEKQRFCDRDCKVAFEAEHGRAAAHVAPVEFACRECSKSFFYKPAYLRAYQKKFGKAPGYCGIGCSAVGRRKDADEKHKTNCKNCGKEFYRTRRKGRGTIYREQELCGKQCKNEWTSKIYRAKHGLPKVTKRIKRKYTVLRIPAQDDALVHEILEHRYVVEQSLGRKLLPEETVHHINGERHDNRIENLELFSSRHGPGQRVVDKVQFAIEILTLYPDFAKTIGYELRPIEH